MASYSSAGGRGALVTQTVTPTVGEEYSIVVGAAGASSSALGVTAAAGSNGTSSGVGASAGNGKGGASDQPGWVNLTYTTKVTSMTFYTPSKGSESL